MQQAHLNFNHPRCTTASRNIMQHGESWHDELTCGLWFKACGVDAIFTNENFICAAKRFPFTGASVRNLIISHQIKCTRCWCAVASLLRLFRPKSGTYQTQAGGVTATVWAVRVVLCGKDEKEMMQFHWHSTLPLAALPFHYVSGALKGEEMCVFVRSLLAHRDSIGRKRVFHIHMALGERQVRSVEQADNKRKVFSSSNEQELRIFLALVSFDVGEVAAASEKKSCNLKSI